MNKQAESSDVVCLGLNVFVVKCPTVDKRSLKKTSTSKQLIIGDGSSSVYMIFCPRFWKKMAKTFDQFSKSLTNLHPFSSKL